MWPGMVVVDDVLTYEAQEVALVQNDDVVEALVPEGFNHALRDPVRLWASKRAENGLGVGVRLYPPRISVRFRKRAEAASSS